MTKRNSNQKELVAALATVLADTYILTVKSHAHHWNVTGSSFPQLHALFETHYNELFAAADEVAERIRALGAPAPASMAQMLELSSIKERDNKSMTAKEMLSDLITAHEIAVSDINAVKKLATAADDSATDDVMNRRLVEHEKTLWMLRATVA